MDNWQNRSKNMLCATCMWYVPKTAEQAEVTPILGRCRRNAPTMEGFPAVFSEDWCGSHKLDENKI